MKTSMDKENIQCVLCMMMVEREKEKEKKRGWLDTGKCWKWKKINVEIGKSGFR